MHSFKPKGRFFSIDFITTGFIKTDFITTKGKK